MSLNQIASLLAFLVGIMSIVAGGKAMQGWNPGYNVLSWLPVYNFVMGLLALIPAFYYGSTIVSGWQLRSQRSAFIRLYYCFCSSLSVTRLRSKALPP